MMVVRLGYSDLVMPIKDAVTLGEIMQRAEKYEKKYRKDEVTGTSDYTYHVWPSPEEINMKLISDDAYRLAKLAGKPEK